ncbi:MAG TPA: M24 family metallopeptidase, partial [Woeseiaceae bacterium]|nr:M24 family metallopeptidase [Woeseiaceae bacterium]
LAQFVRERDPATIALNYAEHIGGADGLTYTSHRKLTEMHNGRAVRDILKQNIKPGRTASDTLEVLNRKLTEAGFGVMDEFNKPTSDPEIVDVIVVSHSVGNLGHGVGPSVAFFNPERLTYTIKPTNLLSIELFAYTAIPEWNGRKLRIPLEDDAVVTERGVEWLYPVAQRVLLIR